MSKRTKTHLLLSALLMLAGLILFSAVMIKCEWDFKKLGTVDYETRTQTVSEEFDSIRIHTSASDLRILPSDDGACSVYLHENAKAKHTVSVSDGALCIEGAKGKSLFGFSFDTPQIILYLPESEYECLAASVTTGDTEISDTLRFSSVQLSTTTGDILCRAAASDNVSLKTTTGDILLENAAAESIVLSVTTGSITVKNISGESALSLSTTTGRSELSDIRCKSVYAAGTTGDLTLTRVLATESIFAQRTTGDVRFSECDAAEITVKTGTGDVSGTLLSEKQFKTDTATGSIRVPQSQTGGRCEISTTTGDIHITVKN